MICFDNSNYRVSHFNLAEIALTAFSQQLGHALTKVMIKSKTNAIVIKWKKRKNLDTVYTFHFSHDVYATNHAHISNGLCYSWSLTHVRT